MGAHWCTVFMGLGDIDNLQYWLETVKDVSKSYFDQ